MFLGIEIGGTKLQLGVGAGDGGPLVALERRDIVIAGGAERILAQIEQVGRPLIGQHAVRRVGFGFGGPVDAQRGRVIKSHQVAGWEDVPLAGWCRERLGVPAVLANDCDSAALAEARFGAGQGSNIVFFVTVGTGIGGGLVIDGRLHGRGRPAVAEIGHLRPGPQAAANTATVESLAAGPGIARAARNRLAALSPEDPARLHFAALGAADLAALTGAKTVAAAAAQGNAVAREVLREACRVLGWALAQVITLTAAETVVVGGGVSLIGEELFFAPLRAEVARYVFAPLAAAYQVVPAQLGEEVVVHGALALAAAAEDA